MIPVNGCRTLDKAGETYIVTADIGAEDDCLVVTADRITIDLGGHTITGPDGNRAVLGAGVTLTVVKNGTISAFQTAIDLQTSSRSTIRNVTIAHNGRAIRGGPNTLVKDCTVRFSGDPAIDLGDGGQVEGCLIESNFEGGVRGGARMLVTRNTIKNNSGPAIRVEASATVTYNTVTTNEVGIIVGPRSLVSGNIANGSDDTDIRADCPSTITNNDTTGNPESIEVNGAGCFRKGNTPAP